MRGIGVAVLLVALIALARGNIIIPGVQPCEVRSNDGSGNNILWNNLGKKGNFLNRQLPSNFKDPLVPNPRDISNLIAHEVVDKKNIHGVNMLESIFGQFINHDRQDTHSGNGTFTSIPLNSAADVLWRDGGNNFILVQLSTLPVARLHPRGPLEPQVPNQATAWLDLSALYGSDDVTVAAMRSFVDGRLKTSNYTVQTGPGGPTIPLFNQLPSLNITGVHVDTAFTLPEDQVTSAGDPRVNENVGLALITTVFLREHNRLAAVKKAEQPSWSDEQVFQWARKMNIAQYQHIVYEEYLPAILSPAHMQHMKKYKYNHLTNANTNIEFSHAAFRYGHSSISNYYLYDKDLCLKYVSLPPGIFGPDPYNAPFLPNTGQLGGPNQVPNAFVLAGGEATILRGLIYNLGNEVDHYFTSNLRSLTFVGVSGAGIDLFLTDVVRGRLDGLASYYSLRKEFWKFPGLPTGHADIYKSPACASTAANPADDPIGCFQVINPDLTLATALKNTYGKVTKIDGFVGLLSEPALANSFLPRTIANIVFSEYVKVRDADRFFYKNNGVLTSAELAQVESRTFAQILLDQYHSTANPLVSDPNNLFTNAFRVPPTATFCPNGQQ